MSTTTTADIARGYIARGWAPIPIPARTKAPKIDGWEKLRIGESEVVQYFRSGCNIGVLNGEPSGWLVDVDLDHVLARELADDFLPATNSEFGRASARRSHRLFTVTATIETLQRRLPKISGKSPMIVELRSTGSQTVFPGSVHPEGERVEWDSDGEPASIAPGLLLAAVTALADEVERRLGVSRNGSARSGRAAGLPPDVADRARKYLAKMPPAVSGQGGHDQTFHAACVLVHGFALDRGQSLELLREWNQGCEPPWSDRELEHKIDDAIKEPGDRGYLLNDKAGRSAAGVNGGGERDGDDKKQSQATLLVEMTEGCELFSDSDGEAYARFPVGDDADFHWEVSRINAKPFRRWLKRKFYTATEKTPSAQSLQDALGVIEAKAIYDGDSRKVFIRVAEQDHRIYLDLGNDRWQAVEIDRHGWRVVDDPPVMFRRAKAMKSLPTPRSARKHSGATPVRQRDG